MQFIRLVIHLTYDLDTVWFGILLSHKHFFWRQYFFDHETSIEAQLALQNCKQIFWSFDFKLNCKATFKHNFLQTSTQVELIYTSTAGKNELPLQVSKTISNKNISQQPAFDRIFARKCFWTIIRKKRVF